MVSMMKEQDLPWCHKRIPELLDLIHSLRLSEPKIE